MQSCRDSVFKLRLEPSPMEGHCLLIAINQDPQIDLHPRQRTERARWWLWVWYTSILFDSLRHRKLSGLQVGVLLFYLPYLLFTHLTAKLFLLYLLELRETGIYMGSNMQKPEPLEHSKAQKAPSKKCLSLGRTTQFCISRRTPCSASAMP